ncbi:MAG: host attachment protein [Alphaproteobacteria bacterium]|nr:host attachment protein [Alphaproteobacteria bacterium]MDE2335900.1 host attachment protein [Alphaproteobacteria bacterium]
MSRISVVAVERHAARLFSRQEGGIALRSEIFAAAAGGSFAQQVAAWLEKKVPPAPSGRLVLFGAPSMLQALHRTIGNPLCAQVIAEIHRDPAALSPEEMRRELEKILWF